MSGRGDAGAPSGSRSGVRVEPTEIPDLLVVRLPVHEDPRGWFKEGWQRAKMVDAGLPDFGPVQHNVSFNGSAGVTRGIHAEPWDKLVGLAAGRVHGAWVDLREGPTFGTVVTRELDPGTAMFVPRGVGNSYQTLAAGTVYSYLVNQHWSEAARSSYTFVSLADPALGIDWPIPLERALLSEADRAHPVLERVRPMPRPRPLLLGAGGQLGRALAVEFPEADARDHRQLDLADPAALDAVRWEDHDVVLNAAAYTRVDEAETPAGRAAAWAANATGVARLAERARAHRLVLVHFSTDYVFDGTREQHDEEEQLSPLGVYGQTKAAGDLAVRGVPRHYLLRTSWVVGEGSNFLRTMASLADRGVSPAVVDDQRGRLTFATELARATRHLLETGAEHGTYNLTCNGPSRSWADIAADVYAARGREAGEVAPVTTEQYAEGKDLAPRPRHSTLDLAKIRATGFEPRAADEMVREYLAAL